MVEYIVGRKPDQKRPHVVVSGDNTVSANHCKITPLGGGLFELEDSASTNGTFVKEEGGWRRISSVHVNGSDRIRLGTFATTVSELLHNANEVKGRVRLTRNPDTGEIEHE
jgi:predicted component of type VI protein secretion system